MKQLQVPARAGPVRPRHLTRCRSCGTGIYDDDLYFRCSGKCQVCAVNRYEFDVPGRQERGEWRT